MKAIQIPYDAFFETKCRLASEVGFRYISVNFNNTPDPSDATYDAAPGHITAVADQYGLKTVQTHLYYYFPLLSADKVDEALEHRILREIEVSGRIGAPWCVWHPRYYKSSDYLTGEYDEALTFHYSRQSVGRYLVQAKLFGTGIALENLFADLICGGIPTLAALCDDFSVDNIGICWDTGHAHLMDFDQADAIRNLGSRIKCTHIHNNFKDNDRHLPPDTGTIPWGSVMKAFRDIGYTGPLTLETQCLYPQDTQLLRDFARHNFNCLEYLQRQKDIP